MALNTNKELTEKLKEVTVTKEEFSAAADALSEDLHQKQKKLYSEIRRFERRMDIHSILYALIVIGCILYVLSALFIWERVV